MLSVLIFLVSAFTISECFQTENHNSTNCTCVPFFQCSDEDYSIITDGTGLIEVRQLNNTMQECEGVFEICCNPPLPTTSTEISTTSIEIPLRTSQGCGLQNHETFSWDASLLFKQLPQFVASYKCRISLINLKVAITAAHCVEEKGTYLVRIKSTIRTVSQIIIHPSYNENSLQNDLAILILNKPFRVSEKIGIVCLPSPGMVLEGSNCFTVTSTKKKVIELPVVARTNCTELLRQTRLGSYFFQLHYSFICAGGNGNQDTCEGDGGSPLMCPVPGIPYRYQQVGIVSWGIGCGGNVPGVYVNLAYFRKWIDEIMINNGFDVNSYKN